MQKGDPETRARYQEFCRKMYAEEVRYVDRWFGDLLAQIRDADWYESSLVVVTSDHGEELFDHGGFEHGHSMHEELLRVPLLVKWPTAAEADEQVSQTVGLVDLAPTFLEFAGAPPMPDQSGTHLAVPRSRPISPPLPWRTPVVAPWEHTAACPRVPQSDMAAHFVPKTSD